MGRSRCEASLADCGLTRGMHEIFISDTAWLMRRSLAPFRCQDAACPFDEKVLNGQAPPVLADHTHALSFRHETMLDRIEHRQNRAPDKQTVPILAGGQCSEQVFLCRLGPVEALVD